MANENIDAATMAAQQEQQRQATAAEAATTAAAVAAQQPTENVVLTKAEYAQMTSAMASMKTALEALVEDDNKAKGTQQQQTQQPQYEQPQIDAMSNTQLLQLVGQHVNELVNKSRQPLIDALATIAVKEELREAKEEYKDFDTYSTDIQAMAKSNPQLNLKQCYILVKAGKPAPTQAATATKIVPTPADRGGNFTPGAATQQKGMSVRAAAEAPLASIKYE